MWEEIILLYLSINKSINQSIAITPEKQLQLHIHWDFLITHQIAVSDFGRHSKEKPKLVKTTCFAKIFLTLLSFSHYYGFFYFIFLFYCHEISFFNCSRGNSTTKYIVSENMRKLFPKLEKVTINQCLLAKLATAK